MRRFLVTSTKFSGTAELFYNKDGLLIKIDMTETIMPEAIIGPFKTAAPSTLEKLLAGGSFNGNATIIEASIEITFEMFWKKYNNKINKIRCQKLWDKLNKTEQIEAYLGIDEYDRFLAKLDWRTKADPETYLRKKYWQNEYK